MDLKEILEIFRGCAEKVEETLDNYDVHDKGSKDMGVGADGTPTKGIDEAAEKTAIDHLAHHTDLSILSEERGLIHGKDDGYVILDPVDGTKNALLDIPFYSISLAYTPTTLKEVKVGYVKNLVTGTEYHALEGEGSYKNGSLLSPVKEKDDLIFSVYLGDKAHEKSFEVASKPRRIRSLGSAALEICYVAEGVFDLYLRRSPDERRGLRITDIAASAFILREVGGEVYGKDLKKLEMGINASNRRDVIAIYDPRVKDLLQ